MSSATNIVNIALRRVGAATLSDLATDTGKDARMARDFYDEARRDLLSMHTWNFAIKRSQLTASSTSPTYGWDYAFPLPGDFIRLIAANPVDDDDSLIDYRLEFQSSDDRVIVTNSSTMYIRYVFDLQDVNIMPPEFRDLLALRLTRDFALALQKTVSNAEYGDLAFRRKLARAKAQDGVQDFPEKMAEGSWTTERHRDMSWGYTTDS